MALLGREIFTGKHRKKGAFYGLFAYLVSMLFQIKVIVLLCMALEKQSIGRPGFVDGFQNRAVLRGTCFLKTDNGKMYTTDK